jgi:N-acyl-D-aspartate/D-glutamate deacylase
LTGDLAAVWGIANRGKIHEGYAADLVLFDPDTIARREEEFVSDFPGEARRYICHADGIDAVIVNGEVVRENGAYTEARAGRTVKQLIIQRPRKAVPKRLLLQSVWTPCHTGQQA